MKFIGEENFKHQNRQKIGVLICNLGTPESYQTKDVRKFLRQFLSDGRVIEIPKIIWWFILNGIILTLRPSKSAKLYKSVWTKEGSPLLVFSKKLIEKLKLVTNDDCEVELAMRYGNPNMEEALLSLKNKNCRKLIVLPMFPQYSGTTTGSIFDEVTRILSKWRWVPSLNFINSYHDNDYYINALADSISTHLQKNTPQKIIFTYHGIPKRNFDLGDPYQCYCQKTTRLVAEKLNLKEDEYMTTFQSRFGPAEWLKPYTSDTMEELPKKGIKNILVVAPAFSVDCLETIEEIDEENKEIFLNSGGQNFTYVPCLNDSDGHVNFLKQLIDKHASILK
ncbi:ferrochelatase [Pelagibacterales bacterium]|mgnify:FL=1|jgi:protoporphyrin/coproporphyrin ferrochelatase|nr:ferrochelatase [Pelagibacterales bacterium]MDA9373006.1 ferrochelatase [Pelagibacterales bacterium]